jgi:hypothetical protein
MRGIARKLENENPLWIVLFGYYSKQFIGFPRFIAPQGTIIAVSHPSAMPGRMREIERAARIGQPKLKAG